MSAQECRLVTLRDGSHARVRGNLPDEQVQRLADAVRADQDKRCHAPSDVPMPEIAQRIHGRETYQCGLYAGHDEPHRWPEKGPARAEWGDRP